MKQIGILIIMYHNSGEVPAESKNILSPPLAYKDFKAHKAKASEQWSLYYPTQGAWVSWTLKLRLKAQLVQVTFLCSIYLDQKWETNFSCNFIRNYFEIRKINQKAKKQKHPLYNTHIFSVPLINISVFKIC